VCRRLVSFTIFVETLVKICFGWEFPSGVDVGISDGFDRGIGSWGAGGTERFALRLLIGFGRVFLVVGARQFEGFIIVVVEWGFSGTFEGARSIVNEFGR
jgi:hypothetical protein